MPGKNALTVAISLLILFTGILSAQDISPVSVQKTSKIKLLKTKVFKHTDVGTPAIAGTVTVSDGGFEYQYRQVTGGEMKAIYPARFDGTPDFPVTFPNTWIRLKRVGNKFTGYTGTDGKSWKEYATFTLDLPEKVYLGAAVTSHKTTEFTTAKFRSICNIIK
jgi:hypothetical protein